MTTRRAFLSSTAAASVLASPLVAIDRAAAQSSKGAFVLVPGAWAGSWIWSKVVPLLQEKGHSVYPLTLTGLGDRSHLADPSITLDTHITDVVNALEFADLHDVALVGHSYSGMVITGVAERVPERLAHLIYLDADVPTDGQNGWQAELYTEEAMLADVASGGDAGMPGFLMFEPYVAWLQAMIADPADFDWVMAKLTPQSLATYIQPLAVGNPAAAEIPRLFVYCTEDPLESSTRSAERLQTEPGWRVIEVANNHLVNVNDPKATANAFLTVM